MAKYPPWGVGTDGSATNLALCVPDITVKAANQVKSNTAALANDTELTGIALGIGTHWVKLDLIFYNNTSATPDIKTRWVFTTGTWNDPLRMVDGPASGNTTTPDALNLLKRSAIAASVDIVYGCAAGTVPYHAIEESFRVVVTVAGTLSLQWAQNGATVADTTVLAGSTFSTRQIA